MPPPSPAGSQSTRGPIKGRTPMRVDERIELALHSPEPFKQLHALAVNLLDQGSDRATVIQDFKKVQRQLRAADREAEEDVLMDVLDCLVDWCSPHVRIETAPDRRVAGKNTTSPDRASRELCETTSGSATPVLYLQTVRLKEYSAHRRQLAKRIFNNAKRQASGCAREETGSFSFDAASFLFGERRGDIGTTAAKVVIYEHGKKSRLDLDEGVYTCIRSTDPIGDSIWCGDLATNFAELFRLMSRDRTIGIAPWPEVGFSFFLFDESRHGINEVGDLLVACAHI